MPVPTTTTYSRLSFGSAGPPSPDRKKSTRKADRFVIQNGSKLHSYARDKAPYPFSYDRDVLELSCVDHAFIYKLKQSVSFINFKGDTPKRCLDLGTGLGDWVIDAAKHWTDCTFVGYDLMNVQIPLMAIDPYIANRIQWVHGNFLRQKLPFDDDEFDHVHIHGLAYAVPENKWHSLYEEVHRVLTPGGTIEVIEEDAVFPVLPKWFTAPLHAPTKRSVDEGNTEATTPSSAPPDTDHLPHAHALLESLYKAVFHNRFLNPIPSSMLPSYFSAFFSHVLSPPVVNFPMPAIAPMPPSPPAARSADGPDPRASVVSTSSNSSSSTSDSVSESERISSHTVMARTSSSSTATSVDSGSPRKNHHSLAYSYEEGTRIGGASALELFPVCDALDGHSLYMQLHRAVSMVLATREAMWEELKERIDHNRESLKAYGWEPSDFDEVGNKERGVSRQKFDALVERYKSDMRIRVSLWHSLTRIGWGFPRREPLSKAELLEEQRLRKAILDAQQSANLVEEIMTPCRSLRLLVGVKALDADTQ